MKKMLVATTALVAVSATPALAADVTLSAYYEFGWAQHSDDTEGDDNGNDSHTFNDTEVHIKFETTSDSGLNYGAVFELEGAADGTQSVDQDTTSVSTKVMDEASLYFKGGFGKVTLGQNDFAHDSFLIWTPTHRGTISQDDGHYGPRFASGTGSNGGVTLASVDSEASLGTGVGSAYFGPNASYNDSEKVTYMSPNLGGFTFGVSWMDSNTAESTIPSFGLKYSGGMGMMDDGMMGGIGYTITANSFDNGADGVKNTTSNQYGITLTSGALTLTASQSSIEGAGGALRFRAPPHPPPHRGSLHPRPYLQPIPRNRPATERKLHDHNPAPHHPR